MLNLPSLLRLVCMFLIALPLFAAEKRATDELLESADSYLRFLGHAEEAAKADGLAPWQLDEFMAQGAIKVEGWKEANLTGVTQRLLDPSRVPAEVASSTHLRERAVSAWFLEAKRALHMGQEEKFRHALSSLVLASPDNASIAGDLAHEWNDNQSVSAWRRLPQSAQVEHLLKDSPDEFSMQARREKLNLDPRYDDELVLRAWSENGWWHDLQVDDLKMRIARRQADPDNAIDWSPYGTLIAAYEAGSAGDADGLRANLAKLQHTTLGKGWVYQRLEQQASVLEQQLAKLIPMLQSFQTADGADTTLQQVLGDGRALLLDFYASWCQPCMEAMPALAARAKEYGPKGLVVVGMNVEADAAKAREVRTKFALNLPWLMDANDETGLAYQLEVEAIPHAALISPEGKLLFVGDPESPVLAAKLRAL